MSERTIIDIGPDERPVQYIVKVEVLELLPPNLAREFDLKPQPLLYASTPFKGNPRNRQEVAMVIADLIDRMYGGTGSAPQEDGGARG